MNNLLNATCLALILTLTGCKTLRHIEAINNDFQEAPESEPHALLRVNSLTSVKITPNSTCFDPTRPKSGTAITLEKVGAKGFNHQSRSMVGVPDPRNQWAEFRVEAEKPITIQIFYFFPSNGSYYSCESIVSFTPTVDTQYNMSSFNFTRKNQCGISISEIYPEQKIVKFEKAPICD